MAFCCKDNAHALWRGRPRRSLLCADSAHHTDHARGVARSAQLGCNMDVRPQEGGLAAMSLQQETGCVAK